MTLPARSWSTLGSLALLSSLGFAQGINVDWSPRGPEVILNTDVARIVTSAGPMTILGGVFLFRNVTIPRGTRVRGEGTRPLIFIVAGTFTRDGAIAVNGGNGQRVDTLNSANFPAMGGRGVCGGGDGGAGSPETTDRSLVGQSGYGPLQIANLGGRGGAITCSRSGQPGSGGGGGTFTTQGDPWYTTKSGTGNLFPQQKGVGGFGQGRTLPGGVPGIVYFQDGNPGNNFFGVGYDVNRRLIVNGELTLAVGGSGGAGGGDYALSCAKNDPNFINDEKGGGGGAGGGVIAIIAEGKIIIGSSGSVSADGGHGGGGAWAGSCNRGGGGAGGAGGFVVLYSRNQIDIEIHGETYANNDYEFAISADGGVGLLDSYGGGGVVRGKYPPTAASNMDARPAGGMGGMGLIQLMARPGTNADGTNTVLDDNIILRNGGNVLTGVAKQRFLAWRGFPNATGVWVDDSGRATAIGDKEGDFRPTPILLPVF